MRKLLSVLALLTVAGSLFAQEYDATIKRWSEGPLTWDDFTLYTSDYPIIASLDYGWHGTTMQSSKIGNLKVIRLQTECYMNPVASWVNPDYRNPQTLQYLQTAFDYTELCRRQLQKELDNNAKGHSTNELSQFYYGKADRFIARLREETDQGRDTAMVNFFAIQTAEELAATPEDYLPEIGPRKWGIAMHFGYGNEIHLGESADYLRTLHGLKWGFDISYGNVALYWHMLLAAGGKTPREFVHEGKYWKTDKRQSGGNLEFDLAYSVFNNNWLNVSPFAGVGVGFSDTAVGQDADGKIVTDGVGGFRYLAGLSVGFKFLRTLDLSNRPVYYYWMNVGTSRGYNENSLRLLAYATHTDYDLPIGPSWTLNLGLVYNIHAWTLR